MVHFEALERIITLRGGVENLQGFDGYLKLRVNQYKSLYAF